MKKNALKKKASKRGQTSVEYILIIAVIVGVIMAFGQQFKSRLAVVTDNLFGGIGTGITNLTK